MEMMTAIIKIVNKIFDFLSMTCKIVFVRVLFISKNLVAGNLAHLLKKEGNEVKLYIENKKSRCNFENMVPHTSNWRAELSWVGKDGLIVFDDVGYGRVQDRLRKQGYTVFGGSELGDKIELDREYGQHMFAAAGMKTSSLKDFDNLSDAVSYIKENPAAWVVKVNDHDKKFYNYVGECPKGEDAIALLENYISNHSVGKENITLHERVYGVEIGIGRYFNGTDWVGPIEFNIEHTRFFPGDLGPTTSEMGTLAWYSDDENNRLYKETLALMKDYLAEAKFRGDFEINCMVNENGAFPLEATARLGSPITHLHSEIHDSPWGEFLYAVASGKNYDLKWKKGYGIVLLMAVPPFPYAEEYKEQNLSGLGIHFKDFKPEDFSHIHFEGVSSRAGGKNEYYISDNQGYVLFVTEIGNSIKETRDKVHGLANRIIIPKVFYRNDIGAEFEINGLPKLKKLGYL